MARWVYGHRVIGHGLSILVKLAVLTIYTAILVLTGIAGNVGLAA